MTPPFASAEIATVFDTFSENSQPVLLALRRLVFETAQTDPRIGQVEEALRWGQPSYLTPVTKSGTTIRLGASNGECAALFVHCRTTLMSDFRAAFPDQDETQGSRALLIRSPEAIDPMRHGWLIRQALTYHL